MATLQELDLPASFTLDDLHAAVVRLHGRPIVLQPATMPADRLHGVWIASTEQDYVFYPEDAPHLHRLAILAHEFWHVLTDVRSDVDRLRDVAARLLPDINPTMIGRIAARTTFDDEVERRAELFSTIVVANHSRWAPTRSRPADPHLQDKITSTLGPPIDG